MLNAKTIQTVLDAFRLVVTRSVIQWICFAAITLYLSAEAIYQGCTLYAESHVRTIPLQSFMMLVSHFFTRLVGLSLTLFNAINAKNMTIFFNQMLETNRRFRVYFRGDKAGYKCARLLWIFKYFLYLQPLIPAFTYVHEYRDIRYWQGAVFPESILPFIRPCFFVVEYWISFFVMSGPIFWGYITCPHCYSTPDWMNVLRLKRRYIDVLEWRRRRIQNGSCILYRGLQVQNQMYNSFYASMTGGGLAACMACLVLMLTFSIQLTPKIAFPGCLIFPVGALALLQIPRYGFAYTVNVTEASVAFIECYRLTRNPVQAKAARSLMPLVIHVSVFYEMSRVTLLEFYSQVVNNTVSMLLI